MKKYKLECKAMPGEKVFVITHSTGRSAIEYKKIDKVSFYEHSIPTYTLEPDYISREEPKIYLTLDEALDAYKETMLELYGNNNEK